MTPKYKATEPKKTEKIKKAFSIYVNTNLKYKNNVSLFIPVLWIVVSLRTSGVSAVRNLSKNTNLMNIIIKLVK